MGSNSIVIVTEPYVELLHYTPSAEELIEYAGRTCYNSNKEDKSIIRRWIEYGHESMIEHASATFRVKCSRVVSHELVRHRIASYSQRSQRYVNEIESNYFMPDKIYLDPDVSMLYANAVAHCFKVYKHLIDKGFPKQLARYVLPNATMTEIVFTMNFRELRHFIKLRATKAAQPEMCALALKVLAVCKDIAPNCFYDLENQNGFVVQLSSRDNSI